MEGGGRCLLRGREWGVERRGDRSYRAETPGLCLDLGPGHSAADERVASRSLTSAQSSRYAIAAGLRGAKAVTGARRTAICSTLLAAGTATELTCACCSGRSAKISGADDAGDRPS